MEAQNTVLVRRAVEEIWNRGQLDLADVLFATGYVNHAGLIPDFVHGPEAIKVSVALYRTAFPDFHITMDELTARRDAVVLRWTARSSAPLAGSASSATQYTLVGMVVCRIAHGQIAESWMQWDLPSVLEQLGLIRAFWNSWGSSAWPGARTFWVVSGRRKAPVARRRME